MLRIQCLRFIRHKKRYVVLFFLIATIIYMLYMSGEFIPLPGFVMDIYYWINPAKGVFCHYYKQKDSLPDISEFHPKKGESIFFHETSCTSFINGKIFITARQACAVESAARMNPDHEVYLLYASPGKFVFENSESDRFIQELMKYSNVNIFHVDLSEYFKGSPIEDLWANGKLRQSKYAQSHTSDALRFLTLWKYGGIYLDLDVIVIKNLNQLSTDFSGVESDKAVAAGILGFNHTGKGHEFAASCLGDLKYNFKGYKWGWNGPGTITRLLKKLCKADNVNSMVNKTCDGYTIYPPESFYVIRWWEWERFFNPKYLEYVRNVSSKSYIIHVWNKFSSSTRIPINAEDIPYLEFAKEFCPNIVKQCDVFF
ncbi:hypothetical protein ABEB36_008761 [Hypothenemus hampei]|uniref:Alpha 1,4-glycosyltransferase domain-containing protein n=1 Tax=Hypothenemus hampei TaxID=57062 RepID=A0ABD1EMZ5_HYPHA